MMRIYPHIIILCNEDMSLVHTLSLLDAAWPNIFLFFRPALLCTLPPPNFSRALFLHLPPPLSYQLMGSLEEVHMPQNGINHAGVTALATAMQHNPHLRILNLNDNTFTKRGALAMAQVLVFYF